MTDRTLTSYEQVPYETAADLSMHPDNLASQATLFGLRPPPPETARILELGCGTGANLIAIADSLPGARCLGIDLSPGQVAMGLDQVRTLGLTNVKLRSGSILDVGADWGTFDYIICHGVYSWVPPPVQDHILTICARNLAPDGVAFISYNVYPGWHISGLIRDMVIFHGRRFPEPRECVAQARGFLDFLTGVVECDPKSAPFHAILKQQVEELREDGDSYLYHEYLEDFNQPVYFHEFAARAAAKDLQFLSEAVLSLMVGNLPPDVKNTLHGWSEDVIQYEQYLDFVRNRRFRKTLLCHAGAKVCRTPGPEVTPRFRYTALSRPMCESPNPEPAGAEQFKMPNGTTVTTNNPWVRAIAWTLHGVYPHSLTFAELRDRVPPRLPAGVAADPEALTQALFQCILSQVAEFHVSVPPFVTEVGERPVASRLARLQAVAKRVVTNRRHCNVELEGLDRALLLLLDGSRDRAALIAALAENVRDGMPLLDEDDREVREPGHVREVLGRGVEAGLRRLAMGCLLVG
jgi:methyltransferase-like protein/SAM-dependent methyltransferase